MCPRGYNVFGIFRLIFHGIDSQPQNTKSDIIIFNPFMPNGIPRPYQLDDSKSNLRACNFVNFF